MGYEDFGLCAQQIDVIIGLIIVTIFILISCTFLFSFRTTCKREHQLVLNLRGAYIMCVHHFEMNILGCNHGKVDQNRVLVYLFFWGGGLKA